MKNMKAVIESKRTIGRKIITSFMPIVIVSIILMCAVSYKMAVDETVEIAKNLLSQTAIQTGKVLESNIKNTGSIVNKMTEVIVTTNKTTEAEIMEYLKEEEKKYDFKTLAYVDTKGNYVDTKGNRANVMGLSHTEMVLAGQSAVSEIYKSDIDGESEISYSYVIKKGDEILGGIYGIKDGNDYSKFTNEVKFGEKSSSFIIDKATGLLCAHKDQSLVENFVNIQEEAKTNKEYESMAKAYKEMIENTSGITTYEYNGEKQIVAYTGMLSDYWTLAVAIDKDELLGGLKSMLLIITILGVISIAVCSIIIVKISRNIGEGVVGIKTIINNFSKGIFNCRIDDSLINRNDELGEIAGSLKETQESIVAMVKELKELSVSVDNSSVSLKSVSGDLNSSSVNVAESINDIAQGASSQTQHLSIITNQLDGFSNMLNNMSTEIVTIEDIAKNINLNATESNTDMRSVNESIIDLKNKFSLFTDKINLMSNNIENINNITKLISDISEKTNLLSLNAAIESARAGEAGRGFSVVAEEIRKLADESSNSTKEINNMIANILIDMEVLVDESKLMVSSIDTQGKSIDKAISSFNNISSSIDDISPKIMSITKQSEMVENEKLVIMSKVDELLAISEEVTASTEEIAAASEEMKLSSSNVESSSIDLVEKSNTMKDNLNNFKI